MSLPIWIKPAPPCGGLFFKLRAADTRNDKGRRIAGPGWAFESAQGESRGVSPRCHPWGRRIIYRAREVRHERLKKLAQDHRPRPKNGRCLQVNGCELADLAEHLVSIVQFSALLRMLASPPHRYGVRLGYHCLRQRPAWSLALFTLHEWSCELSVLTDAVRSAWQPAGQPRATPRTPSQRS